MDEKVNLSICQECQKNPAVYGDGLTWSRCSACQLKHKYEEGNKEPAQPEPITTTEGFKHEIKSGLTSIVIPIYLLNYTLFHYTGNCIGSIREHTNLPFELVIVDNGSPIQPPDPSSYYADRVIKNEANLGVTVAWNQGIRMSTGDVIVLMNNDIQVYDGWLEGMLSGLEQYDLVMAHPMYSNTEPFARAVEAKKVLTGEKKLDPLEKDFACVAFKRSLIDEIGPFDERFFCYASDSDFFRRMAEKGKTFKMLDNVAVSHITTATGYYIKETQEIMNIDRAKYDEKWKGVPEVAAVQSEALPLESAADKKDAKLVRTPDTGDAIFIIKDKQYHHVADPDTLHALGFEFGQEITITMSELMDSGEDGGEVNMENYAKT